MLVRIRSAKTTAQQVFPLHRLVPPERGTQDSNLESPVLETGALASLASAPRAAILGEARTPRMIAPPRMWRNWQTRRA